VVGSVILLIVASDISLVLSLERMTLNPSAGCRGERAYRQATAAMMTAARKMLRRYFGSRMIIWLTRLSA